MPITDSTSFKFDFRIILYMCIFRVWLFIYLFFYNLRKPIHASISVSTWSNTVIRISKRCVFPDFWWDFHWWSQEMDGHIFWHGGHQRLHLRQLCHIKYLSSKVWFLVCGCTIQRKDVVSLRVCRRRWGRSTRSLGAMRLVVNLFQTVQRRLGFLQHHHHHHQIRKTLAAAVLAKIIFLRQNTEGSDPFACLVTNRISPLSLSWPPYGQRTTLSQEQSRPLSQCSVPLGKFSFCLPLRPCWFRQFIARLSIFTALCALSYSTCLTLWCCPPE